RAGARVQPARAHLPYGATVERVEGPVPSRSRSHGPGRHGKSRGRWRRALELASPADFRPLDIGPHGLAFKLGRARTILVLSGFAPTMEINALVISGPDPGAIPGGSTKSLPALSAES